MKDAFATEASDKSSLYEKIVEECDPGALDIFYALNRPSMVQFAYGYTHNRQLSDDVVQDVLAKIYELQRERKAGAIDNAFCNATENFRTWAFRLVATRSMRLNALEKRQAHEMFDTVRSGADDGENGLGQDFLPEIEAPYSCNAGGINTDPLDIMLHRANRQTIRQTLDRIFELATGSEVIHAALTSAIAKVEQEEDGTDWKRGWTGMDYKEIARTLGIGEVTARTRCHNGRGKIAKDPEIRNLVCELS